MADICMHQLSCHFQVTFIIAIVKDIYVLCFLSAKVQEALLLSSWILPTTPTVHFTSVNQLQLDYKDIILIIGTHCICAVNYAPN